MRSLLVWTVPALLVVALVGVSYWLHCSGCNELYWWEVPDDCRPDLHSSCDFTPACRTIFEDGESRDLWRSP